MTVAGTANIKMGLMRVVIFRRASMIWAQSLIEAIMPWQSKCFVSPAILR
jgi:hypothetical protein